MLIRMLQGILMVSVVLLAGCGGDPQTPVPTKPTIGTFVINGDAPYTLSESVTFTIVVADGGGTDGMRMIISEDPTFAGAKWQVYQSAMSYDFTPGDGVKTVYIKAIDKTGVESSKESDEIVLAVSSTVAYFDPCPLSIEAGETGTVRLKIDNASDMISGRFEIKFNKDKLEVTSLTVDTGTDHILRTTGATLLVSDQEYDNAKGTILVGALGLQRGFAGVDGAGVFAEIEFRAREGITAVLPLVFLADEVYCYPVGNPPVAMEEIFLIDGKVE